MSLLLCDRRTLLRLDVRETDIPCAVRTVSAGLWLRIAIHASTRQLHAFFLMPVPPRTFFLFAVPDTKVDQERNEQKTYDRKESSEDRIRFFAAQAIHAFWMSAGTS